LRLKECPAELKILVADMLSAHDLYLAGHAMLFSSSSNEQILQVCSQTVENYLENRAIWKELSHYKEHGAILGAHPLFDWVRRRDQIRQMAIAQLVKIRDRHANNLVRARKTLRDNPGHELSLKRKENIARLERELKEIHALLNLP
jgi:hypothetical protein